MNKIFLIFTIFETFINFQKSKIKDPDFIPKNSGRGNECEPV